MKMIKSFLSRSKNVPIIPKKYMNGIVNINCSELELNKWTISDFVVSHLVPIVGIHPFPLDELMLMVSTVIRFKPQYIFEWGTHIGKSARIFYETATLFDIPCEIHSIDLPLNVSHIEHPGNDHGILVRGIKEVTLHRGDGIKKAMELYAGLENPSRVLFFIDGDHSYEAVKNELSTVLDNNPMPLILLHDTFYQSAESGYNVGPFNAISELMAGKEREYSVISTQLGLPGMTLVYKK